MKNNITQSKNHTNRSATLAKGLELLNILESSTNSMKLAEVAKIANLTKPTTHRLLSTLVDYGMIRFDSNTQDYRLGMRLFELSRKVWDEFDLRGSASAEMLKLNEITGESIGLAIIDDEAGVCIDEIESKHHLRERSRIGQRIALFQSAIGKALVTGLQHNTRTNFIDKLKPSFFKNSIYKSKFDLIAHLDLVNARGYAIEDQEQLTGIMGVAAPIVDHRGITIAAIGLTGPTERLNRERLHELGPTVIQATRRVSLIAGGSPRPIGEIPKPKKPTYAKLQTLVETHNLIGEGPVYDKKTNQLYWVDICRPAIYRLNLTNNNLTTISINEMVTALAIVPDGLLIAAQSGIKIINPDNSKVIKQLGHPELNLPSNRFNDGKCDSKGRFWVGTMAINVNPNSGSLYRIDPNGEIHTMETNLTLPNGMGWSPDNKHMYLIETHDRRVYSYDFNAKTGEIQNRKIFIEFPNDQPGDPDGLAVDRDGNIWITLWDGWRISKFSPSGKLIEDIILPIPRPTGCVFGENGKNTLYITSARIRISEQVLRQAPLSGSVFLATI